MENINDIGSYLSRASDPMKERRAFLKEVVGKDITVLGWDTKASDRHSGVYLVLHIALDGELRYVIVDNASLMSRQLAVIMQEKSKRNEQDPSFGCVVEYAAEGPALFSRSWLQ